MSLTPRFTLCVLAGLAVVASDFQHHPPGFIAECSTCWGCLGVVLGTAYWVLRGINPELELPPKRVPLRDRPRPKPPELIVTSHPVLRERYYFAATDDPNVDLTPRSRHRG